jgi:hypothetical protein
MPIVNKAGDTLFIDQYLGWHAAQFKNIHLLPVQFQYAGFGVRQPDEGQLFFLPVICETLGIFGTYDYDRNVASYKFCVVMTQLRHMLLAEWSGKGAVKHQQHNFLTLQVSQSEIVT